MTAIQHRAARARRSPFTLAVVLAALALPVTQAWAVSDDVERACTADYLAYCSGHDPDGPGVRTCMRAAGTKLSARCVKALIGAGEVSKSDVARRQAKAR